MAHSNSYVDVRISSFGVREVFEATIAIVVSLTPFRLLIAFLFLQPFLEFTWDDTLNVIRHLVLRLIALLVWIETLLYQSRHGKVSRTSSFGFNAPILVYALSACLSAFIALVSYPIESGKMLFALFTLPILISLTWTIPYWFRTQEDLLRAMKIFLLSVSVVGIFGLVEIGEHYILEPTASFRASSIFSDPNIFARFITIGIFVGLSFLVFSKKGIFSKVQLITFLVLCLVNLVFSFSRSGYATLLFGCLLLAFLIKKKRIRFFIILISLTLVLTSFVFLESVRARGGSIFVDASNLNRIELILGGIEMIRSHWFFGIGYRNFAYIFKTIYLESILLVQGESYELMGLSTSVHNWLIEVWAEQGILGLVGLCWIFIFAFRRLKSAFKKTTDSTLQSLISSGTLMLFVFLFHGFFYHTFISQFLFWILFGFVIATVRVAETQKEMVL